MISDILWGTAIGWATIGFITFMLEMALGGKILNILIYDFREWEH
jgi:hypothetical protein